MKLKRIGLVSDSHGSTSACSKALQKIGPVDLLVHLGDGAGDADGLGVPVLQVRGNCDYHCDADREAILTLDAGIRILVCHGDVWNVKWGLERLMYHAMEENVQGAVFGHTHSSCSLYENGIYFVNPGCCRGYRATCARLEVIDGVLFPTILEI